MKLLAESEENAKKLKKFSRDQPGQPPVEDTYPDFHEAIVALAFAGAGANRRCRTEVLNACHRFDDLRVALLKEGYILSQQAFSLRLIPRRSNSLEGKWHVCTVPV